MKNITKHTKTYFILINIIGLSFTKIFGSQYFSPSLIIGTNTNIIYGFQLEFGYKLNFFEKFKN